MRPEREAARKFRAMKKYYAYLRVCVFNNTFGGKEYFCETKILDYLEPILENNYQMLKTAFRQREVIIDYYDHDTVSQINELFRLIFRIENKVYCKKDMISASQKPCFLFVT